MTRLEQLIEELCPNGVKYYTLNSICNVYDGTHQTPQYTESGIKFASVENIADPYATEKYISVSDYEKYKIKPQRNDLLMTRIGSIGVCTVLESDEPLAYYVSLALLRPNNEVLNSRYLKYAIESLHCRKELRKRTLVNAVPIKINMGDIGKITLPVPPLPVQSEIVRILDNFTELTAEITAEITARKKRYEYYTDQLMNFGEGVKMIPLGEIGSVKMCKRILKSQTNTTGGIPFCKIGTFGKAPDAFISEELFEEYKEKYSYPRKGDILISCSGTIGRTVVFDGEPTYFQDSNIVWLEHDGTIVTNKYLQYCYKKQPWQISTGGTIARLYNDNILKAKIPVPPIEEQERIVKILERFDVLCN
ncbi:MAG: restriction endonuclease subunit S, partial [Clostridia bacterium]|nr:restriction endonuclease subunit S [Clostridia bacterium]